MKEQSERKRKKKGEREGKREKKSICLFFFLHKWHPKGKKMF